MPERFHPPKSFPGIRFAGREKYQHEGYFFDNARRSAEGGLVVQRTLSGSAFYEDTAGRVRVGPGSAMLFAHGEESRYGIGPPEDRPYETIFVELPPVAGLEFLFAEIRREFGSVVRMAERGDAARWLDQTVRDFRAGRRPDRLALAERSYQILLAVYREQVPGLPVADPVAHGRNLLQERFMLPWNLKECCAEIGLSREHFCRAFRARYGEAPAGFLRRLRLAHAQELLVSSSLPVEDVSALSGFASAQTFRRAYRRHFGVPVGARTAQVSTRS